MYPCPANEVGLPTLATISERYGVPVGLSDHSGQACFGIAAAALGARAVEVHLAMSRHAFGPDVSSSLTPDGLRTMVEGIRAVESSLRTPPGKDEMAERLKETKRLFDRSIVTTSDIARGQPFTDKNVALMKPGGGLPPDRWHDVLGAQAARDLPAGTFLSQADLA